MINLLLLEMLCMMRTPTVNSTALPLCFSQEGKYVYEGTFVITLMLLSESWTDKMIRSKALPDTEIRVFEQEVKKNITLNESGADNKVML